MKSPHSKWTRALWSAAEGADFRFALTGTPIQDNLDDLWAVLRYVAPEEYSGKTAYVDRFAETGYNLFGIFTIMGIDKEHEAEFFAGLYPRMRRMLKKAVLPFLPPIINETRYVEMHPAQAKAYKEMVKKDRAELEEGGTLISKSPLSRATRLLQFASSYAKIVVTEKEDGRTEEHVVLQEPSNKLDSLMSDIESGSYGTSSLVIFAKSRQLIDMLHTRMEHKNIKHGMITGAISTDDRQVAIDDFQEGKIKYILVTIDAGGVGLTLTAADTMVFLQRSYSSIAMRQAESRAHRIGSERHDAIRIVDYVSEGTIEEQQILMLGPKYERIESIVKDADLLKRLLAGEDVSVAGSDEPLIDGHVEDEE